MLQRRLDNQNKSLTTAPAPVFNLNIGREMLDLLHPGAANPAPVQNPALGHAQHIDINCPTILQANRVPGPDMILQDFCSQYGLQDNTLQRFLNNQYTHARMLRFITVGELKEMGFLLGEIAGVRDAIEQWSYAAPV